MKLSQDIQNRTAHYEAGPAVREIVKTTRIMLLVGVSGAGKDSIKQELFRRYPNEYYHIVTHTTRPLRMENGVMERNGVDYHFIDVATAERMLIAHEYIEANVYSDNVYGTSVAEIRRAQAQGKIATTDVDINGVRQYMALSPDVRPIFVVPPSFAIWQERLHKRYAGAADPADLRRRLQTAADEFTEVLSAPYFYVVINDDLDTAVTTVNAIAHGEDIARRPAAALAVMQDILTEMHTALAEK